MRYNVHPPRAFHNRIAKSIGVLVGAALVATWGCRVPPRHKRRPRRLVTGVSGDEPMSDSAQGTATATWGERGRPWTTGS